MFILIVLLFLYNKIKKEKYMYYDYGNQYRQYQQPYQQQYSGSSAAAISDRIIRVSSVDSAKSLCLRPNSEVLALDENQPILYLVRSDGAGYNSVFAYDITEHIANKEKTNEYITKAEFEELRKELNSVKSYIENDGKKRNAKES